eukprot:tig00000553_g2107.t1
MAGVDAFYAALGRRGIQPGLDRIHRLLAALGRPHEAAPVVHVAGTNGKGSVCAYVSSVFRAAGYRVGRFTSPYLLHPRDCIWIDGAPLSAGEWEAEIGRIRALLDGAGDTATTQFEVLTAAALASFARRGVDVAVMEAGMGGRGDCTNVTTAAGALATGLVSVSLDHQKFLGDTVAAIAREKAGLFRAGRPAVVGPLPPDARAEVEAAAAELRPPARLLWPAPAVPEADGAWAALPSEGGVRVPLRLAGGFQLANAARGMEAVRWPGRLEWRAWGGRELLVDGAHNDDAAHALRAYADAALRKRAGGASPGPVHWVIGVLESKDARSILRALLRPGDSASFVPVRIPADAAWQRSADPAALLAAAREACPGLRSAEVRASLRGGLEAAAGDGAAALRVLCGSLYLVGEFTEMAGYAPS